MALKLEYRKHVLQFKFDAGTSRGVLKTKDSWIIKIHDLSDAKVSGLGEISIIDRLSLDFNLDFERELDLLSEALLKENLPKNDEEVYSLVERLVYQTKPAIRFALETALLDLINGGKFEIFKNDFYLQKKTIPINGLVWMGDEHFMQEQIDQKIKAGYKCIKIKIGAIDFDKECEILRSIRGKYAAHNLTIRVDANGAFRTQEVLKRLEALEVFDLHSIEQPIMPKQRLSMQLVCAKSKIPVALDEELIGVFSKSEKKALLQEILPSFIILKPSILGGFRATAEWIDMAESLGVGWWVTSALESNIGLNAICQFTAEYNISMHQGLGTGQLYENNFYAPLVIYDEHISYKQDLSWDYSSLQFD